MSDKLFHHAWCPNCQTNLRDELRAVVDAPRFGYGLRATVTCPACGAVTTFGVHWECVYAEALSTDEGRARKRDTCTETGSS